MRNNSPLLSVYGASFQLSDLLCNCVGSDLECLLRTVVAVVTEEWEGWLAVQL